LYDAGAYTAFSSKNGKKNLNVNGLSEGRNARRLVYVDNPEFLSALPEGAGNILPLTHNPNSQPLVSNRMFSDDEVDLSQFTPFGDDSFRSENIKNLNVSFTQRIMPEMYLNVTYYNSENTAFDQLPNGRDLVIKSEVVKVFDAVANESPLDKFENPFAPAEGLQKKEIAVKVKLEVYQVNYHVRNIYKKLQTNSLSGAVAKAIRKEYI